MTDEKKDLEPERRVFKDKDDHYNLVNAKGATHLDGIREEVFQFIERKGFSLSTHIAEKLLAPTSVYHLYCSDHLLLSLDCQLLW